MKVTWQHELVVRATGPAQPELGRVASGGLVSGLREDASYVLEIVGGGWHLYVDDIPLVEGPAGRFTWASSFFAGRVEVVSVNPKGVETCYYLEVAPASQKVREDQFASMIDAIRQFDQRLLLGEAAACLGFGKAGLGGKFDELVRWERLRQHGGAFLKCVDAITRIPHTNLKPVRQSLPLAQVKRVPVAALHDRRIVALATGQFPDRVNIDSIQVHIQVPTATVDTPANRAICALLKRFQQALVVLRAWVMNDRAELSEAGAFGRRCRRLEILHAYDTDVRRLLNCFPFRGVKKPETTAAGLTQAAANPTYARAYRTGTEALRLGVEPDCTAEHLHVSPSWGVYETWCFVALVEALESHLSIEFKPGKSKFPGTSPDLVLSGQLPDGRDLELLFQATFRSDGLGSSKAAWSLSKERRPDIVLIASNGAEHRTFVLDAKYRSGKGNVLDAMASAHIYHDSLFLTGRRPDRCLLLLPGEPEVESLEKHETWETYGVGIISGYSVGAEGLQRCATAISTWILDTWIASSRKSGLPTNILAGRPR
jgi:hypothetical protein